MSCITTACMLMVWGYALPAKDLPVNDSPQIVLAAYQPLTGCHDTQLNLEVASGCRKVPAPLDQFWVRCGGDYECPVVYKAKHTDWGEHALPPVTVTAPKKPIPKKGRQKMLAHASASGVGSTPGKPVAEQIAQQLAQQGIMYAAQFKAGAVGFALGGPGGAIGLSWATCSVLKYGFIYQEWAIKERWDLHPEKALGNQIYAIKMCSPIGFIFKAIDADNGRDKAFAMAEGLSWSPFLPLSIAGQVAPATNAALYNISNMFGKSKQSSGGLFWKPSTPYHNGEVWIADTH